MYHILKLLLRFDFWVFKRSFGVHKLEEHYFDKKCLRCGTIRKIELDDCPRCGGMVHSELIDLHIKQAYESEDSSNIGKYFLASFVILCIVLGWFLFK